MRSAEAIKKELDQLTVDQDRLERERDSAIITFFNEEYGAGFDDNRTFDYFGNLFDESDEWEGYFNPYDLQLGWAEVRLFLRWKAVQDLILRQGLAVEALEMLASDDENRRRHGARGITVAEYGIEKAREELQQVVEDAKTAMNRLDELKKVLNKYK